MALIHTEGFECYANNTELYARCPVGTWVNTNTGDLQLNAQYPRSGTACVEVNGSRHFRYDLPAAGEHATLVVGCALRRDVQGAGGVGDFLLLSSDGGGTVHVSLSWTTANGIEIRRGEGGTVLATSAGSLVTQGAYSYIEVKAALSDTTGTVEVRLNGAATPVVTYSGDTKNGGTKTVFDSVRFRGNSVGGWNYYDDIYFLNGAGAAPYNDFIGEVRCYPLLPNGNGNYSQLLNSAGNSTNNYSYVDETAGAASDADYVGSTTVDAQDTYAHADIAATAGTVMDLKLSQRAYKSDAAARSFAPIVRSGGADAVGTDTVLSTSAQRFITRYATNPVTAAAWTNIAEANGAEFGFRVRP